MAEWHVLIRFILSPDLCTLIFVTGDFLPATGLFSCTIRQNLDPPHPPHTPKKKKKKKKKRKPWYRLQNGLLLEERICSPPPLAPLLLEEKICTPPPPLPPPTPTSTREQIISFNSSSYEKAGQRWSFLIAKKFITHMRNVRTSV